MPVRLRRAVWGLLLLATLALTPVLFAASPSKPETVEQPRAYGYLSARIFNFFVQRPVEDQAYMRETVLGVETQGTQLTKGQLTLRSLPDSSRGTLELCLIGKSICGQSVGHKGPATIYGSSVTQFDARVRLVLKGDQFHVESGGASSQSQTQVLDIQTRNPVVERLAWRRANKKVPQVEQEVSRLAEEKISSRLFDEVTKMAAGANESIAKKAKQPLAEVGAWPRFAYSTSSSGLSFEAFSAGTPRAIETQHPINWKGNADLALCVHESLLEQMVDRLMGGKEINDLQILRMIEMLSGSAPRALWVHDRTERWSVVLSATRPIEIAFHDDAMHLVVNVEEIVRGPERAKVPARISVSLAANASVDGLALYRRGELGVELTGLAADAPEAEAHRRFLATKFGGIFPKEFHFDTLAPPAGGFGEKMRHVRPESFHFENGWAKVVYLLHSAPPK